jgi:hypothetical protein
METGAEKAATGEVTEQACAICYLPFEHGKFEKCVKLGCCPNAFHPECLEKAVELSKNSSQVCPACANPLLFAKLFHRFGLAPFTVPALTAAAVPIEMAPVAVAVTAPAAAKWRCVVHNDASNRWVSISGKAGSLVLHDQRDKCTFRTYWEIFKANGVKLKEIEVPLTDDPHTNQPQVAGQPIANASAHAGEYKKWMSIRDKVLAALVVAH